jgi:hypothetical protein
LSVDAEPIGLLVVGGVVLDGGADTAGLDGVDDADGELTGQERVFGEVLEVSSAQWRALYVDAGAEDHRQVAGASLLGQGLANAAQQVRVPR